MRRKAADEVQTMMTTTSSGGDRPIRVTLKAEVGGYLEQVGRAALETLIDAGMTPAEAADWLVKARQHPGSAEAMRFYRRRWVTGLDEPAPVDWVSEEVLDELEAQLVEQRERSASWRRLFLGEWTEGDRA
jgi:hypothetical protein